MEEQLAGLGALAEPVRRALYAYVLGQDEPVSREQAALAVEAHTGVIESALPQLRGSLGRETCG